MAKTYGELDLKSIREKLNIDFAHFTYQPSQCSCCYGPKDLPKRYWKDSKIPEGDDYTYVLFKNANNGSGPVKKGDTFKKYQNIEWKLSNEQLDGFCEMLQEQIGEDYKIIKPEDSSICIQIEYIQPK